MNNQERIERYIRGQLTPGEINQIWIEFIKDPELYQHFITELHLVALIKERHIQKK